MESLAERGLTIVGAGRMGSALSTALRTTGVPVAGPVRRGEPIGGEIVLLAVPDREIESAMASAPPGALLGHTAGALTLDVFGGRESFSIHPLMTVTDGVTAFAGASAAIAGTSKRGLAV